MSRLHGFTKPSARPLRRLSGLVALTCLVVGATISVGSPVHAATYSYSFDNEGVPVNEPVGGTQEQGTTINWGAQCRGPGTRNGYSILGFRSSHDGNVYGTPCGGGYFSLTSPSFVMPAQNVVFTFVWSLNITYDINYTDGPAVAGGDTTTTSGAMISTLPTDPTRDGYDFAGWNTASDGSGNPVTAGGTHGQTSHFTLYAQWSAETLTITYDSQGGSAVADNDGDRSTTIGGAIISLPNPPTRTGYNFVGWNTAADGSGEDFGWRIINGQEFGHSQTSDFTLYAQWTGLQLNITYDINYTDGPAVAGGDSATTSGATISTLPTDPTRDGYDFAGWNTASDGSGTPVTTGAGHEQTSDFTLYAQWTQTPAPPVVVPAPPVIVPAPPVVTPSSFTIEIGDQTHSVQHAPERIMADLTAQPSMPISIEGNAFQPDTTVEIWINSTRVLLGSTRVTNEGTFTFTVNVPTAIEPGEHTLEIVGTNSEGENQTTLIGLEIDVPEFVEAPESELPVTGKNSNNPVNWALALLVAGILVGELSRRRGLLR